MMRWPVFTMLALTVGCAPNIPAPASQPSRDSLPEVAVQRPIPDTITPPPEFQAAVSAGTRTRTGRPGPRYWQNWTDYRIRTRVLTDAKRLEGSASIRYHNRSPRALEVLVMDLTQNFHAEGARRMEEVEVTDGVELGRVQVRGQVLQPGASGAGRYAVDGTKLLIFPDRPVQAGETVELGIDWSLTIPQAGIGERMGYSQDNLVYLAYFYPQMAVFDDVVGWHPDQFLGTAEFYAGFGNYEVTIEAPANWLVMGTGRLTNAEQVLAPSVLTRLRAAEQSDSVVRVLTSSDFGRTTRAGSGMVEWTFRADSVRDVAYSLTRESVWDAARTPVGDRNGDGSVDYARVDAVYRQAAVRWQNVARYAQHAVRFLSEFTGLSYPWPHMSAVEGAGIIRGGMEYPMMTLIGDYTAAGDVALYNVTAHEIAHMWVPMMVATDERRFAWMDEGTTNFNENQANRDFVGGDDPELADRAGYLRVALSGQEGEIMRRSDYHYPGPSYVIATYYKPSALLTTLRGLLGEEVFRRAYHEFYDRWAFKHPYPWDLWNTFEDVSGRNLDWFWSSWYEEAWVLDQAVGEVSASADGTRIVVRDQGRVPMPARLTITLADGQTVRREVPVDTWLSGTRTATVTVPGQAVRVEIDAENAFPDADRDNNVWMR